MINERPYTTLCTLAERKATGELICASQSAEVHVFLQSGRIAWATDSEHPFAFTRCLQKATQIDAESFRDILESCRRERRPLGETLVSWGAVTHEEVRSALLHQVQLAVDVLRRGGAAQTLFLDRTRQFAQYESALTFDIDELGSSPPVTRPSRPPSHSEPAPDSDTPLNYARHLFDSAEGLLWTALLERTRVVNAAPEPIKAAPFPIRIVDTSLLDEAELVALRSPEGVLAGVAFANATSLWCRVATEAPLGGAVSALARFANTRWRTFEDLTSPTRRDRLWTLGPAESSPMPEVQAFLLGAPEMVAALVTSLDGEPWSCGVGSVSVPAELALDLVRRRTPMLTLPRIFEDGVVVEADENDIGSRFRSLMTAERHVLCFAAELATKPRRLVWVFLDRRASQGLGWAYLTSLSRRLMHPRNWQPR